MSADAPRRVTVRDVVAMKHRGECVVMVTAYDALFARLAEEGGVDILLVGDSLNQVLAGRPSTLSATLDQMIYHAGMVGRGASRALVILDMPFLSYQVSREDALRNAGRAMKESEIHGVKLEGGRSVAPTAASLVEIGIPVMGHVGFTPQSVHALGGYRVQGREAEARQRLVDDARALEDAGAFAVVLELVPTATAKAISEALAIPTIGIGAGPHCDGQVLVLPDLLGLNERFTAKFVKHYAALAVDVRNAVSAFVTEVRERRFPDAAHSYER